MSSPAPLASVTWSQVENINAALCQVGRYQIGRTSDGYQPARDLWEAQRAAAGTLLDAAKLCRDCHQLAPFLFLNGNTFTAVANEILTPLLPSLGLSGPFLTIARNTIGHYVAGTADLSDLKAILRSPP